MPKLRIIFTTNLLLALFFISATDAAETVTLNFKDAEIQSVIKSVAKITGKTIVTDPRVKGKVNIVSAGPMDAEEVYDAFLSILQVHDYTAIETGNVLKVVPYARAKQDRTMGKDHVEMEDVPEDRVVTQVYKLKHIPADQLVPVLRPLVTKQSYLAANSESNSVVISDRAGNVKRLLRIIKQIDQESNGEIEVMPLEYADAREVVKVVENLESKKRGTTGEQLKMAADSRTNSILLSGDKKHLLQAKALISHLDNPVQDQGRTQVIFLRHTRAEDLVPILSGMELPETGKKAGSGQPATPEQRSDIIVQAHDGTNALILTAPPAAMQSLQAVIRQLDIHRVQLMIKAVVAEVSTDLGAELGVQWRSTSDVDSDSSGVIGGTNFSATGLGINQVNEDNLAALGGLNGFNLGFFDGTTTILGTEFINLGALVSALATDSDTNILSTPSLVTMDNEEAEIVVGQNVPFITGSFTNTGADANNAVNPFQTIEREDVGLKLNVKPQINEGNVIRLDIQQEVSSIDNFRPEGPVTNTRTISTSVMVEDGKILVLGGLIQDDLQESVQKVPFLGDIPLLGHLFRYTNTDHQKRNLMVFLRPVILQDSQMSSKITLNKYDYIRNRQLERADKGVALIPHDEVPVLPDPEKDLKPGELRPPKSEENK